MAQKTFADKDYVNAELAKKSNTGHTHTSIINQDTRSVNTTPAEVPLGLSVHLKSNGTDGLSDGGSYHSTLMIKGWNDKSGGPWGQIAVTQNNNLYFRSSTSGSDTAWNAWKKASLDGHTHNYAGSSSAGGAATSANKVNANLAIKLNGGTTEGTNLFTFNGSSAKTIDITPASIGAAASSHGTHVSYGGNGSASTVSRSDHTHSYLPLSGGTMTGNVSYQFTGTGGHAIGLAWKNNDTNKTTFGGIGALANAGTGNSLYIGWGTEPWVASNNLQVSSSGIKYKNNKIYHAGDKPTPADIGAAASSHGNHVPTTQTAQNNVFLRNDNTWQKITPENIGAAAASHGTHVTYGGNGSANTVSRSDHTHSYLPLGGGTMTGNITFADVTSTTYPAVSNKLTWNGSTDGADIYYQVDASDKGRLVLNTRDDADCVIAFANKGTIVSTIDNSGNFSGKAATATKATQDSAGQQINTTYIKGLSVSGRTITYTKGDGTTGTITTQDTDTNTTYTANTGIKLNGTTFQHTNAVTAGTAQGDANKTLSWGGTFTIPTVTYDAQGHITAKGTTTMTMPSNPNTDTHHQAKNIVGASTTATANATSSNGSTYLNLIENGSVRSTHKISGTGATTVTSDSSGNITINSTNTTYSAATTSANGLMTSAMVTKLNGIAEGANKYTHPSYTAKSAGFYKVTVDATGHVSATTAVAKSDIEGLLTGAITTHTHSYIPMSGNTGAYSITGNVEFASPANGTFRGVVGKCGTNDYWRVGGNATADNAGYMEIATADDNSEPIYVRQYTGAYATLNRTATLLDASGNTSFPGAVTVGDKVQMKYNSTSESLDFIFI